MSHLFDRLIQTAVAAPPVPHGIGDGIAVTEVELNPKLTVAVTHETVPQSPQAAALPVRGIVEEDGSPPEPPSPRHPEPLPSLEPGRTDAAGLSEATAPKPRVPDEMTDETGEPTATPSVIHPGLVSVGTDTPSARRWSPIGTPIPAREAPGDIPIPTTQETAVPTEGTQMTPDVAEPPPAADTDRAPSSPVIGEVRGTRRDETPRTGPAIDESRSLPPETPPDMLPDVTVHIGRIEVSTPPSPQPAAPPPATTPPPAHLTLSDYMARKRPHEQ